MKLTPFLTFDGRAAEAIEFYCSLFKNSKVHSIEKWGPGGPVKEGSVINARFELDGQEFHAMDVDGGFAKGEGFSIFVECKTQAEVDHLWNALTANGGMEQPCGWLVDRFGFSWQIIPNALNELIEKAEGAKKQDVINAMLQMKKIVIADLEAAAKA
jgi:predicted 3-demethylubiquinone-9 3-methyltransferase (glyoxalase superfamily)